MSVSRRAGLLALTVFSAAAGGAPTEGSMPVYSRLPELLSADGRVVEVEARYVEVDARMRPVGEPVLAGHVDLVLADGGALMLEPHWSAEARRPAAERDQWRGAAVRVQGTMHAVCPEPEIPVAARVGPCLRGVRVIGAAGAGSGPG